MKFVVSHQVKEISFRAWRNSVNSSIPVQSCNANYIRDKLAKMTRYLDWWPHVSFYRFYLRQRAMKHWVIENLLRDRIFEREWLLKVHYEVHDPSISHLRRVNRRRSLHKNTRYWPKRCQQKEMMPHDSNVTDPSPQQPWKITRVVLQLQHCSLGSALLSSLQRGPGEILVSPVQNPMENSSHSNFKSTINDPLQDSG